jgi:hypothetical protein
MSDYSTDEPVESGALDDDAGESGAASTDQPAEGGDLQGEQEGKGYGADEGEREGSFGE